MTDGTYEVEPGVFLVIAQGKVQEARVDGTTVTVNGTRFTDLQTDPRKWNPGAAAGQSQGRATIKAPMPGKVVRVLVQQNDAVEAGQGLVVVEAMKMQNELRSARAGIVTEVHAKEGDTVEAGALMVVVESA